MGDLVMRLFVASGEFPLTVFMVKNQQHRHPIVEDKPTAKNTKLIVTEGVHGRRSTSTPTPNGFHSDAAVAERRSESAVRTSRMAVLSTLHAEQE